MYYTFYMDGVQLPFAPPTLQLTINNKNETLDLINGGEINVLKKPGLTDVEMELRIPQTRYPFAVYPGGFMGAEYFLDKLEALKVLEKPFQFICSRTTPDGRLLFDTNLSVSLEEYEILEDADEGFDVLVTVLLKQHVPYGVKTIALVETKAASVAVTSEQRPVTFQQPSAYTVVKGDCLSHIAQKMLGSTSRWREIYELNKFQIENPNRIYPGQVFMLPQGGAA